MMTLRRAAERFHTRIDWLDSWHTFSFGDHYDPAHLGFRALRVINDDRVAPGGGFPPHPHRDMEIISYVLDGALAHRDSLGHGSIIRPGEVQRMSAGTGVRHSEHNAAEGAPTHFLQIWIEPDRRGHAPGYEQITLDPERARGRLVVVASPDGRDGSVTIHQDALLLLGRPAPGGELVHDLAPGRHAWVHVARGGVALDGVALSAGDGAALSDVRRLVLAAPVAAAEPAEVLVFDLA
jgi:redox-sensitive bicupin YhaK (pirin superfamily)